MARNDPGNNNPENDPKRKPGNRNATMLFGLLSVVVFMVGVSYAAVPLYDVFCRVTGFGGTTQVADGPAGEVLDRTMRIRFTADTGGALPWKFETEQLEVDLRIGEPGLIYYSAENTSSVPVSGSALYNVNPAKAGLYFTKVQCFCFEEQTLQPGEKVDFAVYFYVDPSIADDPGLDDVHTITLSYTFFRSDSEELDDATEDYYRSVEQANLPAYDDTGADTALLTR